MVVDVVVVVVTGSPGKRESETRSKIVAPSSPYSLDRSDASRIFYLSNCISISSHLFDSGLNLDAAAIDNVVVAGL